MIFERSQKKDSLTNPVRDFIREYVGANGNSDWIRECVNGQRICTELLGRIIRIEII